MKRIFSVLIIISILLSIYTCSPVTVMAKDDSFSASYIGTYDSSSPMSFDIYNVDIEQRTFTGQNMDSFLSI